MKKVLLGFSFLFLSLVCNAQIDIMDHGMGCLPETDVATLPKQAKLMERDFKNLPSSFSLMQYCPKPLSQGQHGTCTSWAIAYAFRTILEAVRNGWTDRQRITNEAYSPLFIHAQIKHPNDPSCQKGTAISDAMKRMRDFGVVKKSMFDVLCANTIPSDIMNSASSNRISSFSALVTYGQHVMEPTKIAVIKKALIEKQPVVIAMRVYPSFHYCKDMWDGNFSGSPGYHAMCVIGYDDNKYGGAFLIQNSWGETWGNKGYTWVRYSDFCKTVDQAYTGALPNIPSPIVKKNILKGSIEMQLSSGATMQAILNKDDVLPHYDIRGSFISGSRYRLYLTNNEPAFVYMIGSDLDSNVSRIFPPRDDISPALTYKQSHIAIPNEEWYIEMDNNVGTDYLCVLYSMYELDIKDIINSIKSGSGSFYERLKKVLAGKLVPATDISFSKSNVSFDATTNASVVPIIITIKHI